MKPRLLALSIPFILLTGSKFIEAYPTTSNSTPEVTSQATTPPYLNQFPSVERLQSEIKGADAMETAARHVGACWQLKRIVENLAGVRRWRNQLTPDEKRIIGGYYGCHIEAAKPYDHLQNSSSNPERQKWFKMRSFFELDDGFLDQLLQRFFSASFRADYYRAVRKQPPASAATSSAAIGPPAQPVGTSRVSAQHYLAEGKKYYLAKDFIKAVEPLKKAIALDPSLHAAHFFLSNTYLVLRRVQEALPPAKEAVRLAPKDPMNHFTLGLTFFNLKQNENALASLQEAVRLKPDFEDSHYWLGRVYYALEQETAAVAAFQQAIRLKPDYDHALRDLGYTYVELGRKEEAQRVQQALQRIDPERAKKLQEQIDVFREGNNDKSVIVSAYIIMGVMYQRSSPRDALKFLRRVIVLNHDAESVARAQLEIGNVYKAQQKNAKAIAAYQHALTFYQHAVRQNSNDADGHLRLGFTYLGMGRMQEALQVHRTLQRLDRNKAQELYADITKVK